MKNKQDFRNIKIKILSEIYLIVMKVHCCCAVVVYQFGV